MPANEVLLDGSGGRGTGAFGICTKIERSCISFNPDGKILSQPHDQAERELDAGHERPSALCRAGPRHVRGPSDNNFDSAKVTIDSAYGNGCRQSTTRARFRREYDVVVENLRQT
jgi:hypothetical protein